MIRVIFISLLFFTFSSFMSVNAQWARTYGGDSTDEAVSIQQTIDGGYIVAGKSFILRQVYDYDVWILKLSSNGDIEWQRVYGGYGGGNDDFASSIQQTIDGGYIVAGTTNSFGSGEKDVWILKLDSEGGIEWQKTYGGSLNDSASAIKQTNEGGYVVAGETGSFGAGNDDIWILKLDSTGEIEWQHSYGGSSSDYACSVYQTQDGGYIVAGKSSSFGAGLSDSLVLKLSSDGDIEWQKIYGGSEEEEASSIQQTQDGGYIVAGKSSSFSVGLSDSLVLKLSSDGDIEWQKIYGRSGEEEASSIQQTQDGGYIVISSFADQSLDSGDSDVSVLKLSSNGDIEWQQAYGGDYSLDLGRFIQQTQDGGYIVTGMTKSWCNRGIEAWVFKISSNGDVGPYCAFKKSINLEISDIDMNFEDPGIVTEDTDIIPQDTAITSQIIHATVYDLCSEYCTLTLSSGEGGTTEPSPGTYQYKTGIRISLRAIPDNDYEFGSWGGNVFYLSNPMAITMDGNKFISAYFGHTDEDELREYARQMRKECLSTAAYSSPLHPYLNTLRDFRDRYLVSNKLGRRFVDLYYKYSPSMANIIAKHKLLKVAARYYLLPVIAFSCSMVHLGLIVTGCILLLILVLPIFLVYFFRRK